MKPKILVTVIAVVFGAAVLWYIPSFANVSEKTQEFVRKATIGNLFEIETSTMALAKAQDERVKDFAQQMISDRTRADKKLRHAVIDAKIAMDIPRSLDKEHRDIVDRLAKQSNSDFDEEYIDAQQQAHDEAMVLYEDYAEDGANPTLREFVAEALPTLRQRASEIENFDD